MKLFNKTIDRQLFKQYQLGSDLSKQEVVVKIFNPYGRGTWFIINSDPNDPDYLWAIVDLGYGAEVGSVSRSELENYRGRFGLGFERDLSFDPINAEELYNGVRQGKFYAKGGEVSFIEYKDSEIMYEPIYNKYYANDVEFDSLQEAKDFIDSGEINPNIRDAYSKGLFANGGSINQEYFIKNISFEDQTDISDGEYSFYFELFDRNGSLINDYEGTITETSRGLELDWEVSGVLDEWWEQAEKIIIDAFTEYKFNSYAEGGNVIDAFQIRTIRGQGNAPTEILRTEQEVKFKKGGRVGLYYDGYVPTYRINKIYTKDGKVFENLYADSQVLSGVYYSDKPLREKYPVGKNQLELFKNGGIPDTAIYIPRYNIDYIETDYEGKIEGNHIYGGVWIDMKKQFKLLEEAKKQGRFDKTKQKPKFEAIYNDKKISIEAENLLDAKNKAIAQLKVPKTKVGLLSVYNVKDPMALMYDDGGYLTDEDKTKLIYVGQILRRAVINGDLTVDESNSGLAFEIAEDTVEDFVDDDMEEMGSSDFGYMYRNFLSDYNEIKVKSFAKGGGVEQTQYVLFKTEKDLKKITDVLKEYDGYANESDRIRNRNKLYHNVDGKMMILFSDSSVDDILDLSRMYGVEVEKFSKENHYNYAKGGSIKNEDIKVGEEFLLVNGDVIEIVRLFKENIDEDWVEYKRNGNKQENSVKELRLFINRLSGKKQKSFRERRNEYLEKLAQKEADVWDKIGAESGSEIRNNEKMLRAYAEGVEEVLQKEQVGKGSFDQEDYDFYTDENWHLFNEFLVWNGYYEPKMTKTEKAWREKRYADPKYKNYVSNPKVISLSGNSKPKSSKYILNADIKQVKVKTDEGYEYTFKGTDVLNGVNILEKGSLLKNDATYVAKRNIIYVELKNGEKVKPSNGYWIKKDAKGELFKPESKEEYKVLSNQAIFPKKGVKTYWYVENSKGQTINNTTGKPYKGKEMTNYYFLNEDSAKKFAEKLNSGAFFMAGGKTTFKEKATAIAKQFEGKKVEPKYQKEYGKVYDKAEAKEVGNKIAGSQKAKYDSKMSGGGSTKRGGAMVLAKQIRKNGESWQSALKRANEQIRKK